MNRGVHVNLAEKLRKILENGDGSELIDFMILNGKEIVKALDCTLDKSKLLDDLKGSLEPVFHDEMCAYERLIVEIESGKFNFNYVIQ